MSSPTTRQAYTHCYNIYDQAMDDPRGVRMQLPTYDAAVNLRMRMHQARSIDRDDNARMYDPSHALYGCSIYDALQIRIFTDADRVTWLYIEPRTADIIGEVQPLSDIEETRWLEQNSPPLLGSPTGTKLLSKKSESSSNALSDDSLSTDSTQPDKQLVIPDLRRL